MGKILKFLKDSIFPENYTCELCGTEIFKGRLCKDCSDGLEENDGATCPVCGRKTAVNEICMECKAHLPEFKRAVSALCYGGASAALIAKFKNGSAYLSGYFAELLKPKTDLLPPADGIVYVPMTAKALKRRGYNQSRLLAESLSKATGAPVLKDALIKTKETADQKSLDRAERLKNLSDCFKADKKLVSGKRILIVDDVMTTGATLDAVAFKLKKAGAKEVFAATAASVTYTPFASAESD